MWMLGAVGDAALTSPTHASPFHQSHITLTSCICRLSARFQDSSFFIFEFRALISFLQSLARELLSLLSTWASREFSRT